MNCPKCNAPIGPNDAFCLNCGEKVTPPAASAYADPASYAAPAAAGYAPAPAKKASPLDAITGLLKSKDGKMNKLIPIAAIAVVALILVIIIASVAGGAKSTAKSYLKASADYDYYKAGKYELFDNDVMKKANKAAAKEDGLSEKEYYEDLAADINDYDDEANADFDSYKSYLEYRSNKVKESVDEELSDTYGSDYKIKFKILETEKCTKAQSDEYREDLDDRIESFEDRYDIKLDFDSDDAKQFVEVTYKVIIEGSEDSWESGEDDEDDPTMILVKIKGDWKVFEDSSF